MTSETEKIKTEKARTPGPLTLIAVAGKLLYKKYIGGGYEQRKDKKYNKG